MKIKEQVIKIIEEQLNSNIKLSQTLAELGTDSLDGVEIVMALEDIYSIEISDEDAESWKTVQNIIDYMKSKTGENEE